MRGISLRVGTNLLAFVLFGVGIVILALATFASGLFFDDTYKVTVVIPEAGGVLPRQEVTVLGRAVGRCRTSSWSTAGSAPVRGPAAVRRPRHGQRPHPAPLPHR